MRDGIYQVNKNRNRNVVKTPLRNVSKQYHASRYFWGIAIS